MQKRLSLSLFALHIAHLQWDRNPVSFHPIEGFDISARFEETDLSEHGRQWDSVYLNGKHAGNRIGATTEFAKLVWEYVEKHDVKIEH